MAQSSSEYRCGEREGRGVSVRYGSSPGIALSQETWSGIPAAADVKPTQPISGFSGSRGTRAAMRHVRIAAVRLAHDRRFVGSVLFLVLFPFVLFVLRVLSPFPVGSSEGVLVVIALISSGT
jgi:hypothetical protein